MKTVEFSICLPESVVREAEAVGLKLPNDLERLIREELRRRTAKDLLSLADRAAAIDIPPMTPKEIQAEIDTVRRERRTQLPTYDLGDARVDISDRDALYEVLDEDERLEK